MDLNCVKLIGPPDSWFQYLHRLFLFVQTLFKHGLRIFTPMLSNHFDCRSFCTFFTRYFSFFVLYFVIRCYMEPKRPVSAVRWETAPSSHVRDVDQLQPWSDFEWLVMFVVILMMLKRSRSLSFTCHRVFRMSHLANITNTPDWRNAHHRRGITSLQVGRYFVLAQH